MPAILLDQVAEESAQAGMATVGPGGVDGLVESAVGQGRVEPRAGPFDGAVPERVELFGGVVGGGGELPVVTAVPVGGVPRRADRLDRKSTRLNSSHQIISYAVFCLKKKKRDQPNRTKRRLH